MPENGTAPVVPLSEASSSSDWLPATDAGSMAATACSAVPASVDGAKPLFGLERRRPAIAAPSGSTAGAAGSAAATSVASRSSALSWVAGSGLAVGVSVLPGPVGSAATGVCVARGGHRGRALAEHRVEIDEAFLPGPEARPARADQQRAEDDEEDRDRAHAAPLGRCAGQSVEGARGLRAARVGEFLGRARLAGLDAFAPLAAVELRHAAITAIAAADDQIGAGAAGAAVRLAVVAVARWRRRRLVVVELDFGSGVVRRTVVAAGFAVECRDGAVDGALRIGGLLLDLDLADRGHGLHIFGHVELERLDLPRGGGHAVPLFAARLDGRTAPVVVDGDAKARRRRLTALGGFGAGDDRGELTVLGFLGGGTLRTLVLVVLVLLRLGPCDQYRLRFGRTRLELGRARTSDLSCGCRSRSAAAMMSSIDALPLAAPLPLAATGSGLAGLASSGFGAGRGTSTLPAICFCPPFDSAGADFLASAANTGGNDGGSEVRPAILASLASCSTWRMQSSSCRRWEVISRAGSGGLMARSCPTRAARAFS